MSELRTIACVINMYIHVFSVLRIVYLKASRPPLYVCVLRIAIAGGGISEKNRNEA